VSVVLVVVLSSVISAVIGVFGLLVSERERRKGSAWWPWVLLGTFGVLTNSGGSCEIGMGDMRAGRREALAIRGRREYGRPG
jgi:hypothetical protein